MFTIEQIKAAHSKVKSGAGFPAYIQDMKSLGIIRYEHFVADGHIQYYGSEGYRLSAAAKWPPVKIAEAASTEALQQSLLIHQQGQTDYPTFCKQSAEAGADKWVVDMEKMICIYYDKAGEEMVAENIPEMLTAQKQTSSQLYKR